jgi:hypothetical protein
VYTRKLQVDQVGRTIVTGGILRAGSDGAP